MNFQKELITPKIAAQFLERNKNNRTIKMPRVLMYANDMANGRWKEDTGETIKISKNGNVLDGQHRLYGILKSKTSIKFHIAYNVPEEVFDVIDTGSIRNAGDVFTIEGIKMSNTIPSIMGTYEFLKTGMSIKAQKNYRPTNAVLLEMYYQREKFWQSTAQKTHSWYLAFAKILSPSLTGGMYSLFYDISEQDAESFMTQLCTGMNVENISVSLLRKKLMQDKVAPRKMPTYLRNALIIKSWNYFRKKEDIKLLKFDTIRDEFPIAI